MGAQIGSTWCLEIEHATKENATMCHNNQFRRNHRGAGIETYLQWGQAQNPYQKWVVWEEGELLDLLIADAELSLGTGILPASKTCFAKPHLPYSPNVLPMSSGGESKG